VQPQPDLNMMPEANALCLTETDSCTESHVSGAGLQPALADANPAVFACGPNICFVLLSPATGADRSEW
jgi:hypothetical protein